MWRRSALRLYWLFSASLRHHVSSAQRRQQGDAAAEGGRLVLAVLLVEGQHGGVVTRAFGAVAGDGHLSRGAVGVGAAMEQAALGERRHAQAEDDCDCHNLFLHRIVVFILFLNSTFVFCFDFGTPGLRDA